MRHNPKTGFYTFWYHRIYGGFLSLYTYTDTYPILRYNITVVGVELYDVIIY